MVCWRRHCYRGRYPGGVNDRRLALESWENLFRAQHEIIGALSSDFDDAALSQTEYDVLLTVTRAPEMTARLREITSRALMSQPSVSRLVDRMVLRGLVTKATDPEDGRGTLVTATELGAREFRTLGSIHARHIAERMSALTADEQRQLLILTERLRQGQPERQNTA